MTQNTPFGYGKVKWSPWQPQDDFAMAPFLKMFRAANYTSVPNFMLLWKSDFFSTYHLDYEGFGPELQTRIKRVRKTTNVADARDRRLGREVCKKGFEQLIINI